MSQIYAYNGLVPVVPDSSFVHDSVVLIGDVILAENCYIGPCAVLRGDFGRISIAKGSNVQETCVIHSFPNQEVILEPNSHIGHGAVLHGCHIGEYVLIGMNAVVMDKARIGANCIVGALSFVKAGDDFAPNQMIVGSPARVLRDLREDEIDWKRNGTGVYQALTRDAAQAFTKTTPLTQAETDRPHAQAPDYDPKLLSHRNF